MSIAATIAVVVSFRPLTSDVQLTFGSSLEPSLPSAACSVSTASILPWHTLLAATDSVTNLKRSLMFGSLWSRSLAT